MVHYINLKIILKIFSIVYGWRIDIQLILYIDLVFSKLVCLVILVESQKLHEIYEKNIGITSGFTSEV